ncbi:SDR family oxidoreductase [Algoriphagus algorifonticola]|jgi:NAD(P)H dehydrogenase (quinone)|uniref:SDR family oxidoreductase n=1 Tax=Algoriphagus algorifonticola TaxID=2593007 RepID=UPI0011A7248D|nr:SDR family oxidoreductase [Algoriphagus algorifonticola]
MILVTGATGQLGKLTIDFLLQKGIVANQITALSRNTEKAKELEAKGINVKIGDYDDLASLTAAFSGVEKLLLISSNEMTKSRAMQHINAINAAKECSVKHIVYTGYMRKEENPSSPLWFLVKDHIDTEKYLIESGITYTLFENGYYLDMLMDYVGQNVLDAKTIFVPAKDGKVNFVLRSDIAEGLANVLTTGGHENKSYNIGNEKAVSFSEIAQMITDITGTPIQYVSPEPQLYTKTLIENGVPEMWANVFTAFAVAFADGIMNIDTTDLTKLLSRKPTTVIEYLKNQFNK